MRILNKITATTYSSTYKAFVEKTFSLIRPYVLTEKGAKRALQNEHPDLFVASLNITRVESMIYLK